MEITQEEIDSIHEDVRSKYERHLELGECTFQAYPDGSMDNCDICSLAYEAGIIPDGSDYYLGEEV